MKIYVTMTVAEALEILKSYIEIRQPEDSVVGIDIKSYSKTVLSASIEEGETRGTVVFDGDTRHRFYNEHTSTVTER